MQSGTVEQHVFDAVSARHDEIIEAVRNLVRIPSVVGSEHAAQAFMADLYRTLPLSVTAFEADRCELELLNEYIPSTFPMPAGRISLPPAKAQAAGTLLS